MSYHHLKRFDKSLSVRVYVKNPLAHTQSGGHIIMYHPRPSEYNHQHHRCRHRRLSISYFFRMISEQCSNTYTPTIKIKFHFVWCGTPQGSFCRLLDVYFMDSSIETINIAWSHAHTSDTVVDEHKAKRCKFAHALHLAWPSLHTRTRITF